MKLSNSKRLAAVLALALTVTGISVPATEKASKAADATTATETTGADAKAALTNIINATWTDDTSKQEDTYISKLNPVDESGKLDAYAGQTLLKKDSKVKVAKYDANGDYSLELFALYPKKLEVYYADFKMGGTQNDEVKPSKTIKNVKEVRKGSKKKGTFYVKTKSGKTTSYVTIKYDYDHTKATATYTQTGKTYKKGSKKITKKAFNKFLKTYNKAKKLSFKTPEAYATYHEFGGSIFMYKDLYAAHISDDVIVMKPNPYIAYTCGTTPRVRYVFGKDEAADWNAFRKENINPIKFVTIFSGIIDSPSDYDIRYEQNAADKTGTYIVDYAEGGDNYYEVIVDESTATPKPTSVKCITSMGTTEEMYEFQYGDSIDYSGEIAEPASDMEATADDEYVKNVGCTVRTLTVDCAGTTKEVKTVSNYRFVPYTDTTKGKFTVKSDVDGKELDYMNLNLDTDEWYAAERVLNPESSDSGFGQPTDKITWTAR